MKDEEKTKEQLINELVELRQREAELEASQRKYRTLVEASPDIFYILDPKGHFLFVGGAVEDLLGFTAEELIEKHFTSIIWTDDLKKAVWRLNERRTGKRSTKRFEVRLITKKKKKKDFDIKYLPVELYAFGFYDKPVSAKDKKFLGTYGVARDIIERKRGEEQLKTALKEKEVLLEEIHHRVKNNLQVISSLLSLQFEFFKDKESTEMFKETQNRIRSLFVIHEKLYRSKNLTMINFSEYIKNFTIHLFRFYGVSPDTIKLKINIEDVLLTLDKATPCGLIVNELVSNCLKYAFPGGKRGEIRIELRSNDKVTLIISDNGVGIPKDLDFRNMESLGLKLVKTLIDQLKGTVELDRSAGTAFKILFSKTK